MKKLIALIIALCLLLSLGLSVCAADSEAELAAKRLYSLGLMNGVGTLPDGSIDFGLDASLTREQAAIMLLRLLGKEAEGTDLSMPFKDVSPWARQDVAYAYRLGLVKGTGDHTFGGRDAVSPAMYISFVLRALGYSSESDFVWSSPWTLSDEIGLTHGEYNEAITAFTRADMALISSWALDTKMKGSSLTLLESISAPDEKLEAAKRLNGLGLMSGVGTLPDGGIDFGLDASLTREQAAIMLLRLLGRESESEGLDLSMPFADVSPWAKQSVAYAYSLGLVKGISATAFGGKDAVSAAMYLTFVLRALGYSSESDFVWSSPWTLSDETGLTHGEYNESTSLFTRADMALISSWALDTKMKGSEITLLESISKAANDEISNPQELLEYLRSNNYSVAPYPHQYISGGVYWQLGEKSQSALRGGCGSDGATAKIVCSLLGDDYEEVGCLFRSYPPQMGGGRVFSYVLNDGIYRVFDLAAAIEAGEKEVKVYEAESLLAAAKAYIADSGVYALHIFAAEGKSIPWAMGADILYLPEECKEDADILYVDKDMGASVVWAENCDGLWAEVENVENDALKYADKLTLQQRISTAAEAVAYLDSFVYDFGALDKGLKADIDYLLSLHRRGYTAPETYTLFTAWCLMDDYPDLKILAASADSPQGARLYTSLLIPNGDGFEIVNPAALSALPNPVYGFEEKTVFGFENAEADFVPLHEWVSEEEPFKVFNILSLSPDAKGEIAFEGNYLAATEFAKEEYRG